MQSTFPDAALYATRQNCTIENAKNPVMPSASIMAPQSIGICDDLRLDAGASSGSGGRAFVYNWASAHPPPPPPPPPRMPGQWC